MEKPAVLPLNHGNGKILLQLLPLHRTSACHSYVIVGGGGSGGAMVLGKLPVPGSSTIWMTVGSAALALGAGGGCLEIFLSSIISLFFLPLSGRRPDID